MPVELTDQFNFTTNRYEVFQAPFDEMNPFNVAREAGYRKTVAQTTLKMYKRAASAEYTLLGDARAGPIAMSRMQDTIDKHAELTLICLVINFLVEHPAYEMLKVCFPLTSPNPGYVKVCIRCAPSLHIPI